MPKGRRKERKFTDYLFWILLGLLALKALGLTKLWFNIDPVGVNLSFDLGSALSLFLFGLLWKKFDGVRETVSSQGERIAKIEGMLLTQNQPA